MTVEILFSLVFLAGMAFLGIMVWLYNHPPIESCLNDERGNRNRGVSTGQLRL